MRLAPRGAGAADSGAAGYSQLCHTSPAHFSEIFLLECVVRYASLVRYSKFGGFQLFGSSKCIASTGIEVGTSTVVGYTEEVRYWEVRYQSLYCKLFAITVVKYSILLRMT